MKFGPKKQSLPAEAPDPRESVEPIENRFEFNHASRQKNGRSHLSQFRIQLLKDHLLAIHPESNKSPPLISINSYKPISRKTRKRQKVPPIEAGSVGCISFLPEKAGRLQAVGIRGKTHSDLETESLPKQNPTSLPKDPRQLESFQKISLKKIGKASSSEEAGKFQKLTSVHLTLKESGSLLAISPSPSMASQLVSPPIPILNPKVSNAEKKPDFAPKIGQIEPTLRKKPTFSPLKSSRCCHLDSRPSKVDLEPGSAFELPLKRKLICCSTDL